MCEISRKNYLSSGQDGLYRIGDGVEHGLDDRNGQFIPNFTNSMPHFFKLISWRVWRICLSVIHYLIFSFGDRSEDRAGQGSNRKTFVSRRTSAVRAICGLALPCWKITLGRLRNQGSTAGRNNWEMYRYAFKLSSIRTRQMHVVYSVASQTITPGGRPLCRYRMNVDIERFQGAYRYVYSHQNTARRTVNRLKRWHFDAPVSKFFVRYTRDAVSHYATLPREAAVFF